MMRPIIVEINATGCTNRCRHCFSLGSPPFGELMTVEEVRWVVAEFERVLGTHTAERPVFIRVEPPFEPTAHPHFVELHEFLVTKCRDRSDDMCVNSNGWGLARIEDWQQAFARLKGLGFASLGTGVHGLPEEHDWFCRRRGAFADLAEAGRRALASGLDLTWEIHLNRRNLGQVGELIAKLRALSDGKAKIIWSISAFYMNDRLRALEELRPTEEDLGPVLDELLAVYQREEPITEGAWVQRLAEDDPRINLYEAYAPARTESGQRSLGSFLVTPEFDVIEWFGSRPALHHGNLKTDGIERMWEHVLATELPQMPGPAELARRFGDASSRELHDGAASVYMKLCDTYWHRARVTP